MYDDVVWQAGTQLDTDLLTTTVLTFVCVFVQYGRWLQNHQSAAPRLTVAKAKKQHNLTATLQQQLP